MLKKMFKTILILSLCIGVVLPTNAAVSVSDGSAFVTKAEFAADLNNLSNRMAQLENSLDAKIDSLVSSYLTRNGIWNGASQEIVNKKIRFNMLDLYPDAADKTIYAIDTNGNQVRYTYPAKMLGGKRYQKEFKIVDSFTKSGLCTVEYVYAMNSYWDNAISENTINWYNTEGADLLDYTLYTDNIQAASGAAVGLTTYRGTDYSNWCWQTSMSFFTPNGSDRSYKINRNFTTSLSSDYGGQQHSIVLSVMGAGRPYNFTPVTQSMMEPQLYLDSFFVAKGDSLYNNFVDVWSGRVLSDYCFFAVNASYFAVLRCLQVNDVVVY